MSEYQESGDNQKREGDCPNESKHSNLQIILQMYQMAHSELLTRIQQRDQYCICMIGAFATVLVGLFAVQDKRPSALLTLLFGVGLMLMFFLTWRLWNSCKIYEKLVMHIKDIEEEITKSETLSVKPWQMYIESALPKHRQSSFRTAILIFAILDATVLMAIVLALVPV